MIRRIVVSTLVALLAFSDLAWACAQHGSAIQSEQSDHVLR